MGNNKQGVPQERAAVSLALAGALLAFACTPTQSARATHLSPQPTDAHSPHPPAQSPSLAPVTDYLPAAGLRWLVTLEPASLPNALHAVAPELLPVHRIRAFEKSTGVHLSRLEQVAIAGYAYSTLLVARTRDNFTEAARRFERRLSIAPTRQQVADRVLVLGLRDQTPVGYVSLDASTAAWVEGNPIPAKAAVLLAGKQLKRSRNALADDALRLLPSHCQTGDLRLYVPGPIHNPYAQDDGGGSTVLGHVLAASINASLKDRTLHVHACIVGDWAGVGVESVRHLVKALGQSTFARLLELEPLDRTATYTADGDLVEVRVALDAERVLTRLDAIVNLKLASVLSSTGTAAELGSDSSPTFLEEQALDPFP